MSRQETILQKLRSAMQIRANDMARLYQKVQHIRQETEEYSCKAQEIYAKEKYQDWIHGARSNVLVIDDDSDSHKLSDSSPACSRVCCDLVDHPERACLTDHNSIVLYFFCGKHTRSGPETLVKLLILQFLEKATFDNRSFDDFPCREFNEKLRKRGEDYFLTLCSIFIGLLQGYSGGPVLIAIDGTMHWEMREDQSCRHHLDTFWQRLIYWILEESNNSVVKLVTTNHGAVQFAFEHSFGHSLGLERFFKHQIYIREENPGPSDPCLCD
jgi:hypothetical protein